MSNRSKTVLPEVRDFADQVGEFIQYWGFKKVHGRIWTHLFLSKTPLDAAEIMKRLSISKALVSMSLSDLLAYDVVEEMGKSTRGTLTYAANADVLSVILNVIRQRERRMFSRIVAAHKLLDSVSATEQKTAGIDRERLEAMGGLINLGYEALETFLSRFRFDLSGVKKINFDISP
jgi:DNA-binding transcriptional regulator GbsR (MarR family)